MACTANGKSANTQWGTLESMDHHGGGQSTPRDGGNQINIRWCVMSWADNFVELSQAWGCDTDAVSLARPGAQSRLFLGLTWAYHGLSSSHCPSDYDCALWGEQHPTACVSVMERTAPTDLGSTWVYDGVDRPAGRTHSRQATPAGTELVQALTCPSHRRGHSCRCPPP